MNILTETIPGHWPAEAKTLVNDLRRAYRALEADLSECKPDDADDIAQGDEIWQECEKMGLTPQQGVIWRKYRQASPAFVSMDRMLMAVYSHNDVGDSKIIDVHVCRIRKCLKASGLPFLIETRHGVGKRVVSTAHASKELRQIKPRVPPLVEANIGSFVAQDDIRKLCWAAGVQFAELSRELGLYKNTVAAWVAGNATMPVKRGVQLANFFKAKQSEMLKAIGSKPKLAA